MIMYNLLSLNLTHVSFSEQYYTSKQGFCCRHCFISLMSIQTVKLKLESDMSLECFVKIGLLVLTRNLIIIVVYTLLDKILTACTSIVFTILGQNRTKLYSCVLHVMHLSPNCDTVLYIDCL